MPRYKLTVAYDGTDFHGWQKQHPPDEAPLRTVQGVLETSVRDVVREPITLLGASRTDSGVHAKGQVATFASETTIPVDRLARAINSALPDDVVVVRAGLTHGDFNPIQDAVAKGYRYRIAHGLEDGTPRPLFDRHVLALSTPTLDPAVMHAAAQALVGKHDFASFTRKHHGRESTVRRVDACSVTATSRRRLRVDVSGNGFLYNMVRIMVGTLVEIGKGRLPADAIPGILDARDRSAAGTTMPPEGLCLEWIRYPVRSAARGTDPEGAIFLSRRIMHISTRLIIGGSQENTILSCAGQAEAGDTVCLVYGPIYGPEGSLLEKAESYGTFETIETPHLVRQLSPWRDWRCLRDLRHLVRTWRPDVVHTHSSKAGVLGRMAAWREGVPCVVHTIHGLAFHPYQAKWRNAIYIASERFAARRCHTIVCVADAMREQSLAEGIGHRDQYVTVYSGMEVDRFLDPVETRAAVRRELGIADDEFVIGTVARLAELKGHDDLLDAAGPLMQTHPQIRLLWVGDGWWRDRLLGRVRELGLEGRVVTTGLVSPQEIPRFLQAMDLLVHPSYREGLPRAVTQALLSGVAVVANDVDGTKEVCRPDETGCLVQAGDTAGLATALEWMVEHPEERLAMGARGRALCRQRFSAETMVRELESVYARQVPRPAVDEAS